MHIHISIQDHTTSISVLLPFSYFLILRQERHLEMTGRGLQGPGKRVFWRTCSMVCLQNRNKSSELNMKKNQPLVINYKGPRGNSSGLQISRNALHFHGPPTELPPMC